MTGTGDVRECARGAHCSGARDGQGVYGPRAFCDQDAALIRRALDDTPTLYAELRELLGDKTSGAESGRRAPSADPAMPINAGVEAALAALSGTILAWEERLRPVLGLPPAPAPSWSREPARVAEACRLMSHRLTALLSLPLDAMVVAGGGTDHRGGADAGLDILDAYRAGDRLARPHRAEVAVPVPCPRECGGLWLLRRDGSEHARCPRCGAFVPADEYRAIIQAAADAA